MATAPTDASATSTQDLAPLFEPIQAGELRTAHRVWMAPLTRSRSKQPGDVPWELNAEYYRQRANPGTGAGLIVSEATQVSPQGKGYAFTPGIHSDEQVEGWRRVTDAVHAEGGLIVLQLWHVGRISHTALQPGGGQPVAPSAIRAQSKTYIDSESGMVDVSEPRALATDEVPGVVDQFRDGAQRAKDAGFDGVEIHGANGYLLDQFIRAATNTRTDRYGGDLERRARFCLEVAEAVCGVWGAGRVGYRISPMGKFNDMADESPAETFAYLAGKLAGMGLAFLHVVEEFGPSRRTAETEVALSAIRNAFKAGGSGIYVGNGSYSAELAAQRIGDGMADAVTFGKPFISNPDLAHRYRTGAAVQEWDESTFYGGTEKGYTDYPALANA
ncbi:MAG: alkene reductase [Planctomycetota bacterium]